MPQSALVESWHIHNRIHLYMLDATADAALSGVSASKGRSVAEQFAHIHNVRPMWLTAAAQELLEGQIKLENDPPLTRGALRKALESSSAAIARLLETSLESGKVKIFKPHATAFFAYLISHESHHRGQIAMTLKQSGHPLEKKTSFGMWEWGVR